MTNAYTTKAAEFSQEALLQYRAGRTTPERLQPAPIPGFPASIQLTGKIFTLCSFAEEIRIFFSSPRAPVTRTYDARLISALPEPVQRYFRYALKEGAPYVNSARMRHTGEFRLAQNKPWTMIHGEQYFTTETPGFVWRGVTTLLPGDAIKNDHLTVTLLNFYSAADPQCKDEELLRWLSGGVWFPTSLLPSDRIEWAAIDRRQARLHFHYEHFSTSFLVNFNDAGQISRMQSEGSCGAEMRAGWIVKLSGYKKLNGIMVPTANETLWRLKSGDTSYAKIRLTALEYDTPSAF